jgi:hypothetical protein
MPRRVFTFLTGGQAYVYGQLATSGKLPAMGIKRLQVCRFRPKLPTVIIIKHVAVLV